MKLVQIPFSGGGLGKGNGANLAPEKIVLLMDKQDDCPEIVNVVEKNIVESHKNIYKWASENTSSTLFLGGDHSITYPIIKGMHEKISTLLIFDAHPDLMDDFKPPTHEDYLRVIIEESLVKPKNIVLVGVRKIDKIESDYIKQKQIIMYTFKEIKEMGFGIFTKKLNSLCSKQTYLSLDIDVIAPEEAPGTGYREKGGFSSNQVLTLLSAIKQKIFSADIVEVNPLKDVEDKTSRLAAKISNLLLE